MKYKNIIGIAMALMAAGVAEATVYLVKEGKVVASYNDDEVDGITFEDPTVYDQVTESTYMKMTYYSDAMSDYGYNYYLFLSDKEPVDGNIPFDATAFSLRLKAPESGEVQLIPAGTYRLGTDKVEDWTIRPDVSSVACGRMYYDFKDATLELSYDESSKKIIASVKATDINGRTYSTTFNGTTTFEDQSLKWLNDDIDLQAGTLTATYLPKGTGFDMNCNMNIMIAENGYDENGWLKTPGNLITFVGNVKLTADGKFAPATWNIMDGMVADENTLLAGCVVNFRNASFPVNTTVKRYNDATDIEVGLVKSGSASISEISPGMYRFVYDFTTNTGHKLTGRYVGRIEIKNLPQEETFHLTEDYQLNLENAIAQCYKFSDEVKLDIVRFNNNYAYVGDRVDLRLVPKGDFGPGIYKVTPDDNCAGSINIGTVRTTSNWSGSVFVKYSEENGSEVIKAAGITGGQIEIKDNGDGTWTIIYDLVDDQTEAHKITGSWTGAVEVK